MRKKKDPFADIADFMYEETIDGWKDTLDGFRDESLFVPQYKEAYYVTTSVKEVEKLITMFESKYGRKLKYRQIKPGSMFYVSYIETELGPDYDRTVLNKHMESYTAFKRDQQLNTITNETN